MQSRNTNSQFGLEGRIDTRVHSVESLREAADDYDSLSKQEKMELSRQVQPEYVDTTYNVTTDSLHQYFVDNLDRNQSSAEDNVTIEWLALGTDGSTAVGTSDTDLSNRTFEKSVTDVADNGKDILSSTFLDSTEGNSAGPFEELGLFSGDPANKANADVFLMNHATFSSVTKDNTKTVTFDVTLTFSDA